MQLCTTQSSEHDALTVCSYVRGLITSLGRTEPPSDAQVAQVTRITINVRYRYASIDGIHPRVADRTHTGRTQPLWWSVGGSVGRSVVRFLHSAPLRFVVYRRRKWGDGRWEIGEICRHVGSAHRSRVSLLLGRGGCYAAVTQAANVFHLIRFDLLNCINRARPGCFSPLLSFRAFISSRARTGGVRNSDCFKINTSSTQHRYLTETWPHSVNHQFYNSSCLRAFPLYFIYIFATVRNPTLSLSAVSSNGKGSVTGCNCWHWSIFLLSSSLSVTALAAGAEGSKRLDRDGARINRSTRDRLPPLIFLSAETSERAFQKLFSFEATASLDRWTRSSWINRKTSI